VAPPVLTALAVLVALISIGRAGSTGTTVNADGVTVDSTTNWGGSIRRVGPALQVHGSVLGQVATALAERQLCPASIRGMRRGTVMHGPACW
jgi:hypothetical protein